MRLWDVVTELFSGSYVFVEESKLALKSSSSATGWEFEMLYVVVCYVIARGPPRAKLCFYALTSQYFFRVLRKQ